MTDATARALVTARRMHVPQSAVHACPVDAAAAYATQSRVAQALGWFRDQAPRYWKSGGPSRQAVMTHAALPPEGVWQSPADASGWPFRLRGIEAEIALRLGQAVTVQDAQALDLARARTLVDAMCVSIEIVDSRWQEALHAPDLAKLADLQSHGALVLGDWVAFEPRDWSTQTCRVTIGSQAPVERCGSHAMGDPAFVLLAWLRHLTRDGDAVAAGTVVTTGTWVGILDAVAGDRVDVAFAGIGAASVQL
ncbi:MAG: fumarylacetoacetate hydrolase family protein [Rhodoferax sp.]|nr:fumarylacetoacetate hydrolase family protein [Rhodoferax sp.]MCB2004329.1 fumarylacetoacetate hydrolase family protein [Rhodoferax sp.]MCB2027812.1 fumarylacetoacetate hydrolase family protein [Rhodoferax sp.]MCB2039453.1 fumarylacetoacetate hydrolase family protein [Rhodoferax sp.]